MQFQMIPGIKNRQFIEPWNSKMIKPKGPTQMTAVNSDVTQHEVQGISHLKQLSKLGAQLRQMGKSKQT
jgi:hypothetical protein